MARLGLSALFLRPILLRLWAGLVLVYHRLHNLAGGAPFRYRETVQL
jgi:hypothetical protein